MQASFYTCRRRSPEGSPQQRADADITRAGDQNEEGRGARCSE